MRKTRLSLFYLLSYLTMTGLALLFVPQMTLKLLFANHEYSDAFVQVTGVLLLGLAIVVITIIQYGNRAFYRATLIVTTKESGLQSVEAVERYAARIPSARVIVLPGDSFHIAAVEPEVCAQHALRFMAEVSRPKQIAASREVG